MDSGNFSLTTVDQTKDLAKKTIQLTPIDIRNKDFRKVMRGYSGDEVDKFLETISKEYELLYSENFDLRERLERSQNELDHYRQLENTLKQTMVLAQQTGEEVKQAAHNEAELLLKEAEHEKNRRVAEAQKKLNEIQEEIEELIRKRELIRTQLKSFLNAHLDLTNMYERQEGER